MYPTLHASNFDNTGYMNRVSPPPPPPYLPLAAKIKLGSWQDWHWLKDTLKDFCNKGFGYGMEVKLLQ